MVHQVNPVLEWLTTYLDDPAAGLHAALSWVGQWAVPAGLLGAVLIAGVVSARLGWRRACQRRMAVDARVITVLAPPKDEPGGGEALWSNLVGILRPRWQRFFRGQPHVAWEYVFTESGVQIRLWVPGLIPPGLVERAVQAAWPGAHTRTEAAAEHPWPPDTDSGGDGSGESVVVAGQVRLARPEAIPIRSDFDTDPLRALLGAPVGLAADEHACVQILVRPATGHRLRRARRSADHLSNGPTPQWTRLLLDLITPGTAGTRAHRSQQPRDRAGALELSAVQRAVVGKQRGSQYETLVRYAVHTTLDPAADVGQCEQIRAAARGRAHALAAAMATYTDHNHYTRRRLRRPTTALATRSFHCGDVLSVRELAGLAHLPADEGLPGLHRAGARALGPPPGIVTPGEHAKPLGNTDAGHTRPVGLRVADARHHLHVLGATGSGKSTLLAQLILADAEAGRGGVVIDPKGDLVTDVLTRLPARLAENVVVFDADSPVPPPCLNPLDGGETDMAVDNLVSVFRRVFSAFWGPRTDDVMRAACLTLRAQDGIATLADLPRLLAEPAFRARVLRGVNDPVLRGFWSWYDELTDSARSQVTAPLMNKLRAFLLRPFVRDALTAGKSTVDMKRVLDGGWCLVRIPKGSLGEDTTRLLGSLVVARAWQATTARAAIPQHDRRDAAMVIDECHNFLNLPYPLEDMLAEARGFRVSMTLAHQHLAQLPKDLREGISTNARNKIYFSASPEDARELARHTAPHLAEHDLAHLDAFHVAARVVLRGQETSPFTLATQPLSAAVPGRARHVRSTTTGSKPREDTAPQPVEIVDGSVLLQRGSSDPRRT